jgi:hypothetical protein
MNTFHTRMTVAAVVLYLLVQGQSHVNSTKAGQTMPAVSRTPSSQPVTRPTAEHVASPKVESTASERRLAPDDPETSASTVPKELFSQLTLFLFASGVAFFIALLAWSDQIRGIDKDVRELEERFLKGTGIEKRTFLRIVKPESPDDRALALLEVLRAERIKTKDSAEVLRIFSKWNKEWSRIESLSAGKYYATIVLTIVLFGAGIGSLFTNPSLRVQPLSIHCRVEMLILMPAAMVVAVLLVIIICIAVRENALRTLLKSVSDMV